MDNFLVVNDIPGAGKVAANINVPIITSAGFEVALLPTVLLSTHTGGTYDNIVRHEMGVDFERMIQHWEDNAITFKHYLSGYFSDVCQLKIFTDYFEQVRQRDPHVKLIMDPIMADNGIFYDGFDQSIADSMSLLTRHADVILPNITEACMLTNTEYDESLPVESLERMCDIFIENGTHNVVITGVRFVDEFPDDIGFYVKGEDTPGQWVHHRYYDQFYFGTGDVVVSAFAAYYAQGYSIIECLNKAGEIIEDVIQKTNQLHRHQRFGLYFEDSLYRLMPMKEATHNERCH